MKITADSLRAWVSSVLPAYMVPAAYVEMEVMPLTPNGKLDRRALPAPDGSAYVRGIYEPPQGVLEESLAQIWCEVLKVERVGRHDNFFELGGHSLLVVRVIERMRVAALHADIRTLFTAPTLAGLAATLSPESNLLVIPPNGISPDAQSITSAMLPLVQLSVEDIAGIVDRVPGGAPNVQDIYPLAPLQEGILFHHLLDSNSDPYVLRATYRFADRSRVDAYLAALQAVIDRHDILRTSVVWEGLAEPVQVVWRQAPLVVEDVVVDDAADVVEQLKARFDSRHYRLDVRQAPLMRVAIAREGETDRWAMVLLVHHLASDHTTLEAIHQEIQAYLLGEADRLPAPLPFRNFVAQSRLGISREEHKAFFRQMLGEVDEPTIPFGLVDVLGDGSQIHEARRRIDRELSRRLRSCARAQGVSVASICHVAWARVLGAVSGRDDVVFGTVLFGRMQGGEGSDRVLGLFINTLPVRIQVGQTAVRDSLKHTHEL